MIFKNWNILILIVSVVSIITALIAEFIFNLQPCELCLKQRHPYYFMILVSVLIFFIPFSLKIFGFMLIQISSIYGLFYAIWHVGVEFIYRYFRVVCCPVTYLFFLHMKFGNGHFHIEKHLSIVCRCVEFS